MVVLVSGPVGKPVYSLMGLVGLAGCIKAGWFGSCMQVLMSFRSLEVIEKKIIKTRHNQTI